MPFFKRIACAALCALSLPALAADLQAGKPAKLEGQVRFQDFQLGSDKFHVPVLQLQAPIRIAKDVQGNGPSGDQTEIQVILGSKIVVWCGGKKSVMPKNKLLSQVAGRSLTMRGPLFNKDRPSHFTQAVILPTEVWLSSCAP
jgi:hypothetical protein